MAKRSPSKNRNKVSKFKKGSRPRRKAVSFLELAYKRDYTERPVDTEELLCGKRFFGSLTGYGKMVHNVWLRSLEQIRLEGTKYIVIHTGAIGIGKSRAAIWGVAGVMQRLLCLKKPWSHFELAGGGKLAVVFFSLNKSLGKSKGFDVLQQHLMSSSWFRSKGIIRGSKEKPWLEFPLFEYKLGSPYAKGFGTLGEDVITGVLDELDSPNESIGNKERVLAAYESAVRRHENRFLKDGETMGKLFLVSSKQEQMSFLNTFVEQKKNNRSVYIVDAPMWEIKKPREYSGKKFMVMLGNAYVPSKIIETEDEKREVVAEGFDILQVPVEYKQTFVDDIDGSLKDLAGVSITSLRRSKLIPVESILRDCFDKDKKNPVKKMTIILGLKDNEINLMRSFDIRKLHNSRSTPRFIHMDIAYAGGGDSLAFAMSCIGGSMETNVEEEDGTISARRLPIVETEFVFRLRANPGDQIPIFAVRKFVLDLKLRGINIVLFTSDLSLLSADTKQILMKRGVNCDYLSLDRTPEPYLEFRNLIAEKRWTSFYHPFFFFEMVNLEYDRNSKKVDHPKKVKHVSILDDGTVKEVVLEGSKDVADAVVGSAYSAVKHYKAPVDSAVVKRLSDSLRGSGNKKELNPWWLSGKREVDDGGAKPIQTTKETYLLQDMEGYYWIWDKAEDSDTPNLSGPFKEKVLNLPVITVSDPVSFSPDVVQSSDSSLNSKYKALIRRLM